MGLKIKNWHKFQHFRDRRPPWIKLYRDLLDDVEWHDLDPIAAKALVMLWLIASETDGNLPDIRALSFRLRMSENQVKSLILKLKHYLDQDDIDAISSRYQDDAPETETETERETEKENISRMTREEFDEFWQACPRRVGKEAARKAYGKAIRKASHETLMTGIRRYAASRAGQDDQYTVHPATWLNQGRWADEGSQTGPSIVTKREMTREEQIEASRRFWAQYEESKQ